MGVKLLWTGLTLTCFGWVFPEAVKVGSIIMAIGCLIMWIGKP